MQLTETLLFHSTSPPQLPVSHNSHVTASQMSLYHDDVIFWTLYPHYWWLSIELILSECTSSHLYVPVSRYFLKRMTGYLILSTFLCIHEVLLRRFLNISVYFVCLLWYYFKVVSSSSSQSWRTKCKLANLESEISEALYLLFLGLLKNESHRIISALLKIRLILPLNSQERMQNNHKMSLINFLSLFPCLSHWGGRAAPVQKSTFCPEPETRCDN